MSSKTIIPATDRRPVPYTRVVLHEGHDSAVSRRDAPESCQGSPSKIRGRRECRVRAAPAVSCARCTRKCAHEHTGSAEASGIPCVMALRLMPRSPRRRIRLVTVVGGFCDCSTPVGFELATADLAPATGVRTTRFCRTLIVLHACQSLTRFNSPCDRHCAPTLSRPPHPIPRS